MSQPPHTVPASGDGLLVVDAQNDFLPGGALPVPHGDDIIPTINSAVRTFVARGLPVFASRDWHPRGHCSFRDRGGPWPPHCIANTHGAAFAAALRLPDEATIVSKAETPDQDAYSAFEGTPLDDLLRRAGVTRLFVGGLATDYCVLASVQDARRNGYDVVVLKDGVRAVDVQPGDGERALETMRQSGAVVTSWAQTA